MSDIRDDVEKNAEEALKNSDEPHLGDAMDEAEPQPEGTGERSASDGDATERRGGGNALDDVDLEPPSS